MNPQNTDTTSSNNDLTPLKERANSILNAIDTLLSGLNLTPEDAMLPVDASGQPSFTWWQTNPSDDIDPKTGLPRSNQETGASAVDPKTGLPIADETTMTPDVSKLEGQISSMESKLTTIESKANSALNTANMMQLDVKKALMLAQSAQSVAARALKVAGSSGNSAVDDSDAETPSYIKYPR